MTNEVTRDDRCLRCGATCAGIVCLTCDQADYAARERATAERQRRLARERWEAELKEGSKC